MASCTLDLTGQIVVGGDCGCGGGFSGSGGPQKLQPLSLACSGKAYESIQSTDCSVRVNSPNDFVPLPIGDLGSTEFLFLQTKSGPVTLRWGGEIAQVQGTQITGGVTFVGGETFDFDLDDGLGNAGTVAVVFDAGSFTLQQVVDRINSTAIGSGFGYMPAALDETGTFILLSTVAKGQAASVTITAAQPLIGFAVLLTDAGTNPTEVRVDGTFMNQWPDGEGVDDLEIKGTADIVVLAAGKA